MTRFPTNTTLNAGKTSQPWLNLVGTGLLSAVSGGIFVGTFGVFLPVYPTVFGWNRGQLSVAFSLSILASGLPSTLWGILVVRLGSKFCILMGNFIAALGIGGLFFVQQVWHVYLLYIIIGLGAGLGTYMPCVSLLQKSFKQGLPFALGLYASSAGIGSLIFPLVATRLISLFGWRNSYPFLALALLVVLLVGWVIIKDPSGATQGKINAETAGSQVGGRPKAGGVLSAFKYRTTWIIVLVVAGMAFVSGFIYSQQAAYIQDIGYSPMTAATILSLISAVGIAGSLGYGAVALRISVKYLTAAVLVVKILGFAILISTANLAMVYVASILLGLSIGACLAAVPILVGTYGGRHYTHVWAIGATIQCITQSIAATGAGAIHDATGTYVLALIIGILLAGAAVVSALLAPKKTEEFGSGEMLPTDGQSRVADAESA